MQILVHKLSVTTIKKYTNLIYINLFSRRLKNCLDLLRKIKLKYKVELEMKSLKAK